MFSNLAQLNSLKKPRKTIIDTINESIISMDNEEVLSKVNQFIKIRELKNQELIESYIKTMPKQIVNENVMN